MLMSTGYLKERIICFVFPLLLAAPFLQRAYFVDDSYFVQIAAWLKDNPAQPYHFRTDDAGLQTRGWEEDGFVRMVNPLAHHYYLAFLMKIGGAGEGWLRFGCVLLSCFGALFLFELARRLTYHPLLATLLVLATPVHWLTSYSLLIDGTLGFFFFGALYLYVRMIERDSLGSALLSGLFMGMAILTKYPGVFILPLTLAWAVFRWRKISRRWLPAIPWIIGLGCLAATSLWTAALYGRPHILAASDRMVQYYGMAKALVFLVFFSGATLVPLLAWRMLTGRAALIAGLTAFVMAVFFSSSLGGYTVVQSSLLSLWTVTTGVFLYTVARARSAWEFPKDHFLVVWVAGFILMMAVVMGWVAARYFVIVVPAVVFLVVRLIEIRWPSAARKTIGIVLAVVVSFTALLAYADFKQAAPSRDLPGRLAREGVTAGERHFFLGDSFTMSYLKDHGWIPAFQQTEFKVGDRVLSKQVTMPQVWFFRKPLALSFLQEFDYPTSFPIKVMDNRGSAGFYASVWGALPFTFSSGSWETFRLFEVIEILEEKEAP